MNHRAECIVIVMASAIFVLGIGLLIFAYWQQNPYIAIGALILQGFLYWPVREIIKLRRDNLILQILPGLVSSMPPDQAGLEIIKLLAYLRKGKDASG